MDCIICLQNGFFIFPSYDGWEAEDSECSFFYHSNPSGEYGLLSLEVE